MLVPRALTLGFLCSYFAPLQNFGYSPHTDLFISQSQAEGLWEEERATLAASCMEQAKDRHLLWPV